MSQPSSALIAYIYKMAGAHQDDNHSDAQLLMRYAQAQDEKAFSALMVRHGPSVWAICRRVLTNTQDVEEAYQSTFLTLACKAKKVRGETLPAWLRQVAHQTAVTARRKAKTQLKLHKGLQALTTVKVSLETKQDEDHEALHEELAKLPENLRVAIVLHYLEGKTEVEVAQILGLTQTATWSRIMRGRTLLRKRLSQKGLMTSAPTLATMIARSASQAAMPPGLVGKTVKAATAFRNGKLTGGLVELVKETLKHTSTTAPWWKTGWMITIFCAAGLGIGAGGFAWKAGFFGTEKTKPNIESPHPTSRTADGRLPETPPVDLYGDPLPPGGIARLGTTRFRWCGSLLFTRSGKELISCGDGKRIQICDVATGRVLRSFGRDVRVVALSHDGSVLASRSPDENGGICIWNPATGKLLRQIQAGAMDWNAALIISPDGTMVASAGHNSESSAWELATGKVLWAKGAKEGGASLTYSSDSKHLIEVAGGNRIQVLNARTGESTRRWGKKQGQKILGMKYSSDGSIGATIYEAQQRNGSKRSQQIEICACELATGKELRRFPFKYADLSLESITLSPNGKVLATGHWNENLVRIWDVDSGKERMCCRCQYPMHPGDLAVSLDGRIIAVCNTHFQDQTIHLWDIDSGREMTAPATGHRGPVMAAAFSRDGKEIISGALDGEFRAWDATTGAERLRWGGVTKSNYWPLAVTGFVAPDGRTAASVELVPEKEGDVPSSEAPRIMRIVRREGAVGREIKRFPVSLQAGNRAMPWAYELAFSPDNKILACSGVQDEDVDLFDLSNGKLLHTFPGDKKVFSPDGRMVAVRQAGVCIRDVKSGKKLCSINGGDDGEAIEVKSMAFTPDGRVLAIRDADERILLWQLLGDAKTGIRVGGVQTIQMEMVGFQSRYPLWPCLPLEFSPDGRMLAASDKNDVVHVYETATGMGRLRLEGHAGEVSCLVFAPDGRRLATGSKDGSILVWDATGGKLDQAGRMIASLPTVRDIEGLWGDLIDGDARRAARAVWTLASAGTNAVSFLEKHVRPVRQLIDRRAAAQWIADLDSGAFTVRKQAQEKLAAAGNAVEGELSRALHEKPSVEKRRMLRRLLEAIDKKHRYAKAATGEELRSLRAIEVLGHIATPAANKLLESLAGGAPSARSTLAAKAILQSRTR